MRECANCRYQMLEDSSFCPNCGQPVAPQPQMFCPQCHAALSEGLHFCPGCGYALQQADQPSAQNLPDAVYYTTNRPQSPGEAGARDDKRRKDRWRIVAIVGIVLAIAVIGIAVQSALYKSSLPVDAAAGDTAAPGISSGDSANAAAGTEATDAKANAPAALEYPANGYIFYGWAEDNACPLTIETQGDQAYFVKLEDMAGEEVFAFFVRPGQIVDTEVPLGNYVMKYASGTEWYGLDYLFGADTVYTRADDIFDFTYIDGSYNGWTVTFYTVADGNMTTDTIDATDF